MGRRLPLEWALAGRTIMRNAHAVALACFVAIFLGRSASWSQQTAVEVPFKLDQDSKVSLLLTAEDGKVVRELLHAEPRKAGANEVDWDGLDESGQPVSAGTYQW